MSRSLCCPTGAQQLPYACWSLQCSLWLGPRSLQAVKVVFSFIHSQTRALFLTQGRKRQGTHWCAVIYASNWLTWMEAWHQHTIRHVCGYGHTWLITPWKVPDVMNIDFNSRRHQTGHSCKKTFCIHTIIHSCKSLQKSLHPGLSLLDLYFCTKKTSLKSKTTKLGRTSTWAYGYSKEPALTIPMHISTSRRTS